MAFIPRSWAWVLLRAYAVAVGMVLFATASSGQELKIGLSAEPSAMDPHYHTPYPRTTSILSHVFERLIATDEKQRLLPGLAESWKVVGDTVWEFKLRRDVKWHDGSPFTADDVVFTFQRAPQCSEQVHRASPPASRARPSARSTTTRFASARKAVGADPAQ